MNSALGVKKIFYIPFYWTYSAVPVNIKDAASQLQCECFEFQMFSSYPSVLSPGILVFSHRPKHARCTFIEDIFHDLHSFLSLKWLWNNGFTASFFLQHAVHSSSSRWQQNSFQCSSVVMFSSACWLKCLSAPLDPNPGFLRGSGEGIGFLLHT